MKKSLTHIRTSHVGRLPPPKGWEDMPARLANAELTDPAAIAAEVTPAIAETVKKQVEAGIDCIGDGEFWTARSLARYTAHFTGNYPPLASVEGTAVLGYPTADDLLAASWSSLVDKVELEGDSANLVAVRTPEQLVTHVRLTIHPDGGVARLRVFGEIVPDPRRLGGRTDLAALVHGGRIEVASDGVNGHGSTFSVWLPLAREKPLLDAPRPTDPKTTTAPLAIK